MQAGAEDVWQPICQDIGNPVVQNVVPAKHRRHHDNSHKRKQEDGRNHQHLVWVGGARRELKARPGGQKNAPWHQFLNAVRAGPISTLDNIYITNAIACKDSTQHTSKSSRRKALRVSRVPPNISCLIFRHSSKPYPRIVRHTTSLRDADTPNAICVLERRSDRQSCEQ